MRITQGAKGGFASEISLDCRMERNVDLTGKEFQRDVHGIKLLDCFLFYISAKQD